MLGWLLAVGALAFSPADAHLAYETARGLVEEFTPRDSGTIRARLASNYLLDAASAAGADVRRDVFKAKTPIGEKEFINLYGEFRSPDPDARWVVLVSHYDTKTGVNCPGANDGASTSGLLVAVANAFSDWEEPKGNLMLVWTDGEEALRDYAPNDGLWGSKRAVEYLQARNRKVQAVICLDMLGDRELAITVPANGTPALAKIAVHAAKRAGFPGLVTRVDDIVRDDHVAFLEKGYSAIDLIDFNYGSGNAYWHTAADTMDKVSELSLLKSGKLVVEMLKILL